MAKRNAAFAVPNINQGYSLAGAIHAWVSDEDRAAHAAFVEQWKKRAEEFGAANKALEDEYFKTYGDCRALQEFKAKFNELWNSQFREFGLPNGLCGFICPEFIDLICFSHWPFARGVMCALRSGEAIVCGRNGGSWSAPKQTFGGCMWAGEWAFFLKDNIAVGGNPETQILDICVFSKEYAAQALALRPKFPTSESKFRELCKFLKALPLCGGEKDDWAAAEDHFGMQIKRVIIRKARAMCNRGGKSGPKPSQ